MLNRKDPRISLGLHIGKTLALFFVAVYILALPSYYLLVARPLGLVDALLPWEAAFCVFVSGVFFVWFGLSVKRVIYLVKK